MSERPRLPVEPLSDRRWQEIRRNVLAEAVLAEASLASAPAAPPAPARAPVYFAAFAAAALLLVLVWTSETRETPATALSRFVTDDSSATASAGDATVALGAHTSVLIIERASDAWVVSLESGTAHFDVPPRGDRPPFTVEAGRTRVQVIGTAFTVTRAPGAPSAEVSVDHGAVRVTDGSVNLVLHDGEQWPARVRTASIDPTVSSPEVYIVTDATPPPSAERAATRAVAPSAPRIADAVAAPVAPALVTPAPEAPVPPVPPGSIDRDRYRDAESREATEPAAALAIYADLASHPGPWSAPALFSQARLEAELGHRARARELAETYLARHPAGINAQDARELARELR